MSGKVTVWTLNLGACLQGRPHESLDGDQQALKKE